MRNRGLNAPAPKPKKEKIDNTELVAAFKAEGGQIYHVPPQHRVTKGVTFAFKDKGNRIEFATAVQHTNDTFTRKDGTKTAIEHFNAGKVVTLPRSTKTPVCWKLFDFIYSFSH